MSIKDLVEKIKPFYFLFLFIIIAGIFFALGRLSSIEERHTPIKIIQPAQNEQANVISAEEGTGVVGSQAKSDNLSTESAQDGSLAQTTVSTTPTMSAGGQVVASKTGTKYYFPWCAGAKRIKPENQITFASADLARSAGYTPAANCKGLK